MTGGIALTEKLLMDAHFHGHDRAFLNALSGKERTPVIPAKAGIQEG